MINKGPIHVKEILQEMYPTYAKVSYVKSSGCHVNKKMGRWLPYKKSTLAMFVLFGLIIGCSLFGTVALNVTGSLPQAVFFVSKHKVFRTGDLVGYWMSSRDNEFKLIIKIVAGMAGDVVTVKNNRVFINGRAMGFILPERRNGDKLTPISEGIIPDGKLFVFTPHPHSFDSRYEEMGLIDVVRVEGRAYAIF